MDERIFARFHLDAGVGDGVTAIRDYCVLGLAGIRWHPKRREFEMTAREQQFAEKVRLEAADGCKALDGTILLAGIK
jgi:hypothetical protein